jgi:hypothetical protein
MTNKHKNRAAASPTHDPMQDPENTGKDLKVFTQFPRLPTEIRQKLWRFCFPRGRRVNFEDEFVFKTMKGSAITLGTEPKYTNQLRIP